MLPRIKHTGNLTYEPKLSFDKLIGCEYTASNLSHRRRVKVLNEKRTCQSIEPGDTINVQGRYSKVLISKQGENVVAYSGIKKKEADLVSSYSFSDCVREPELFCAWFPGGRPVHRRQWDTGLIPGSPAFLDKMEAIQTRSSWLSEEISKYKNTNLYIVAAALGSCSSDGSGVIFRNKLEACLMQMDVISPLRNVHTLQMEKIMAVFNYTPTRSQLERLSCPHIIDDNVEFVLFSEMMAMITKMVNGTGREKFEKQCFSLYDHDRRGFIHLDKLRAWKAVRWQDGVAQRHQGYTPYQVKVFLQIFSQIKKADEERAALLAKKSKSKDSTGAPPFHATKQHLDLDEFSTYLGKDPQLLASFLPVCFLTLYVDLVSDKEFVQTSRARLPPSINRTYSEFFITSSRDGV